jgi:DNA-binding IclR family transcriptional regulator
MRTRTNLASRFPDLSDHHDSDRQFITALARGLDVIRCFQPGEGPLGNQEIAAKTSLPKATVSRITYTLSALGYLEFLPKWSKYQLGAPVLSLGYAFLNSFGLRSIANPHMQQLADRYNCAVGLGARDRLSILYVDLCRGPGTLTLRLDVGSRLPIPRSTTGFAFVASLPEPEREFLEDAIRRRHPDLWERARAGIEDARVQLDQQGFVVGEGVFEKTINTVAAPFVTPDQSTAFVFNMTGPSFELKRDLMVEEAGPRLVSMLQNISSDWLRGGAPR